MNELAEHLGYFYSLRHNDYHWTVGLYSDYTQLRMDSLWEYSYSYDNNKVYLNY